MPSGFGSVTSSRFEAKLPPGKHAPAFKVAFGGSDAAAARYFHVSRMAVWRWRHDRSPLPRRVAEILHTLVNDKVADAHAAEQELRWFLQRPPPPPRKLSGCCAGRGRKAKELPVTAEDWAALRL
jgi:hypothetical protein